LKADLGTNHVLKIAADAWCMLRQQFSYFCGFDINCGCIAAEQCPCLCRQSSYNGICLAVCNVAAAPVESLITETSLLLSLLNSVLLIIKS
jgi:hypothetical protein